MSLDELREDLKRNMAEARHFSSMGQPGIHLHDTLWPFLEALVETIEEIDDAVAELVDQQEDYLQPETAAIFAAVVQSSLQISAELKKRAGADALVAQLVANHEHLCEQAVMVLGQVTMVSDDEDGDNDEAQADATDDDGGSHE